MSEEDYLRAGQWVADHYLLWSNGGWRYELARLRERAVLAFVWRLPRWLVYWCAIRLLSEATTGEHSSQIVPELLAMDALKRWGSPDA